jgi:hypothetical protein
MVAARSRGKNCNPESAHSYLWKVVSHGIKIYRHFVFSSDLGNLWEMVYLGLLWLGLDFLGRKGTISPEQIIELL